MKKAKYYFFLIFCLFSFIFGAAFSSWNILFSENIKPLSNNTPNAYVQRGNKKKYFSTIEKALDYSMSGDLVVVVPPDDPAYYPTDSDDRRPADLRINMTASAWNSIATKKVEYTIKRNCEVKEGVSLILPNENISSSVTNTTQLSTYITSMKKGTYKSEGESIFYRKNKEGKYCDYSGITLTDQSKKQAIYNFHSSLSNGNTYLQNIFLRTTVIINNNVNLVNNGSIVVSGKLSGGVGSGSFVGHTSHSYSRIIMKPNSKITQNSANANIYCFGYIHEDIIDNGSLIELSSGDIYLPFLIRDFRGAVPTLAVYFGGYNTHNIIPFNQFECRNIEPRLKLEYNAKLFCLSNMYVSFQNQEVDAFNEVEMIGKETTGFIQFNNSSYSGFEGKYNKNTEELNAVFYGGFNLGEIKFSIDVTLTTINVKTSQVFFPVSYRNRIHLCQGIGQATTDAAIYDLKLQKVKLMPGSELTLNSYCQLKGTDLSIYTAFYEGESNGTPAYSYGGNRYPVKDGAIFRALSNSKVIMTNMAGNVYCDDITDSSQFQITNQNMTTYEVLKFTSTGQLTSPYKTDAYYLVNESFTKSDISLLEIKKIFVGKVMISGQEAFIPRAKLNFTDNSSISLAESFQSTHFLTQDKDFSIELVESIFNIIKYPNNKRERYEKDTSISTLTINKLYFIGSSLNISNNNNGINEFDAQSITISSLSSPIIVDGVEKDAVIVGKTINLKANVVDIVKTYNKTIIWSSSNPDIVTIDNAAVVKGISEGEAVIKAKIDNVEASFKVYSYTKIQTIPLGDGSTITDDVGNTSAKTIPEKTYHGSYSGTQDIIRTFTINPDPINANLSNISWTFKSSGADRQNMLDMSNTLITSNTISGTKSVKIKFIKNKTGISPDPCSLSCDLEDYDGNIKTIVFNMNHEASSGCLVKGTHVIISTGQSKKIEEINKGMKIKGYNHENNSIEDKEIIFNYSNKANEKTIFNLNFENGISLGIEVGHTFFDLETNQYEFIYSHNCYNYLNHRFKYFDFKNNCWLEIRLLSIAYTFESVSTYTPVTENLLNCFANGFLSMPEDIEGVINIFEYNKDGTIDLKKKEKDILTYGLFDYSHYEHLVPRYIFDVLNMKYFKISIAKNLLTEERVEQLVNTYVHLMLEQQ